MKWTISYGDWFGICRHIMEVLRSPSKYGGPCARGWWRWITHVHNLLCLRGTWQLGCPQISVNMPWFQPCDQQSDHVWEGVEKKELSLTCASQSAQPNTCWDNKLDGKERGNQKKIQPRTLSVMDLRIKINGSKTYLYIYILSLPLLLLIIIINYYY